VLTARVVWVDGSGAGLQLLACDADTRARIAALAAPAHEAAVPDEAELEAPAGDVDDHPPDRRQGNLHDKLRGLSLAQQIKAAQSSDPQERVFLERLYSKNVWEALLRNPRITAPEVMRIARMATLPKPLIEVIVGNGAWLQMPEVRRALLTNPRLAPDQVMRVVRLLGKPDLKVIATTTAYPASVREAARRLLRGP
jgi:hypothetical protein